jgi:ankyrin repeat protein
VCPGVRGAEAVVGKLTPVGDTPPVATVGELFERAADAVVAGDLDALRTLLDNAPELVTARSPRPHRATLLHYCAANGTEDPRQRTPADAPAVAALLLDRGADPDAECQLYDTDTTTLHLVLTSDFPRDAGLDGELVRVLAAGGARIDGGTPIVTAITHGRPRSVTALAEAGVLVDDLFRAAGADRVEVLESLLAGGADPNTRFTDGWTALHAAASTGHRRAAELLLGHGARADVRERRWGADPAGLAGYHGHPELAEFLRRSAADR